MNISLTTDQKLRFIDTYSNIGQGLCRELIMIKSFFNYILCCAVCEAVSAGCAEAVDFFRFPDYNYSR